MGIRKYCKCNNNNTNKQLIRMDEVQLKQGLEENAVLKTDLIRSLKINPILLLKKTNPNEV